MQTEVDETIPDIKAIHENSQKFARGQIIKDVHRRKNAKIARGAKEKLDLEHQLKVVTVSQGGLRDENRKLNQEILDARKNLQEQKQLNEKLFKESIVVKKGLQIPEDSPATRLQPDEKNQNVNGPLLFGTNVLF